MDDAQGIVLLALQRAGVSLPDDVHSVGDLRSEQLLPIYVHALTLVRGSPVGGLPAEFPKQRMARFRVCADLVAAFKQLGYRGELNFHQFLYPSEADTHRLLRFLLDQLSQASSGAKGRSTSRKGRGGRVGVDEFGRSKISGTVRQALTVCLEEANNSGSVGEGKEGRIGAQRFYSSSGTERVTDSIDGEENEVLWGIAFRTCPLRLSGRSSSKKQPPLITIQAKPRTLLVPSILELNARSAEKLARLADAELAQLARQAGNISLPLSGQEKKVISRGMLILDKEKPVGFASGGGDLPAQDVRFCPPAEADERSFVETPIAWQPDGNSKLEEQTKKDSKAFEQKIELKGAMSESNGLDERPVSLKEPVNLASDASQEAVLQELELTVEERDLRMQALQAEWEEVRSQLEEEMADSLKNAEGRNSEIQIKLKRMREMRQEVKDMTANLWAREAEEKELTLEFDKVARGAARTVYVRRITELIRNSKKQDADIVRIIRDTRELQRESNMTQDKLRRIHALVDETIFRDAKRDPVCRQAYRLLTSVHGNFESIVQKVLEMDKLGREISEFQAKLEDLEKRQLDLGSLEADLEAIVAENNALDRRLAELSAANLTV